MMEQIRVSYRLVMVTCLVCLGFNVGTCSESDLLIKTYVSSPLPPDLVYSVPRISGSDWDSLVMQSKIPVMVLFRTEFCALCHPELLEMEPLALQFKDKFKFYTVDVNEDESIQERYNVFTIPTIIVFIDGYSADRIIGYQPGRVIEIVHRYT